MCLTFWVSCVCVCVCVFVEYTLGVVDSSSVHHLWTMHASWCQLSFEYYLVCLWNTHLGLWIRAGEITCEPCMTPDVYSRLFKTWCVYVGIYTGDSGLVECASLVNLVCILMSIVSLSIMCVWVWYVHLVMWTRTVCITCESCIRPDIYSSLIL